MRRATLALALAPVIAGPAAVAIASTGAPQPHPTTTQPTTTQPGSQPATAQQATTQPAPPSDSHASAVKLDDLLSIGETAAHAGGDGGSASASALSLGGHTLIDGTTGGSQSKPGSSSGALLDTGSTPLGSLALTPWTASATQGASGSTSSADAAVAHATLVDNKTLDIWVLHSRSDAAWTPAESSSSSTSDGASVNAGDGALNVLVLHSESKSGSQGSSSLLSINGNEIGSSDQANGQCVLKVPGLLSLTCLDATGGKGSSGGSSTADTLTATLGSADQPQAAVTTVGSRGAKAPTTVKGEKFPNNSGGNTNGPTVRNDRVPNAGAGSLPFTGFDGGLIAAYGAALTGLGAAILRVARRRRPHAR